MHSQRIARYWQSLRTLIQCCTLHLLSTVSRQKGIAFFFLRDGGGGAPNVWNLIPVFVEWHTPGVAAAGRSTASQVAHRCLEQRCMLNCKWDQRKRRTAFLGPDICHAVWLVSLIGRRWSKVWEMRRGLGKWERRRRFSLNGPNRIKGW